MRVSVSQIKNFRLCPTKWYISSVLKIREPEKPATELGKKFHDAAEAYLAGEYLENKEPKIQTMLDNAKPFLDSYLGDDYTSLEIEKEIRGELCEGIDYLGYIDIWNPITKEVTDLKTGNPDYFLTEYQLPNDLQLNIYAHDRFMADEESLDPSEYTLTHIQSSSKTPHKCSKISAPVSNSKIHKIWAEAQETAKDMKSVVDNVKDLDWEVMDKALARNKGACNKYGGCPYKEICWQGVDPEYVRKSFTEENKEKEMLPKNHPFTEGNSDMDNKMTFKEKIAAAKAAGGATAEIADSVASIAEDLESAKEKILADKESPSEPVKEKRKPGRPKKEKPGPGDIIPADKLPPPELLEVVEPRLTTQFCIGAIPFKSGIQVTPFSEILQPFEKEMAEKFKLTDIRQDKFNEPVKALCNSKAKILEKCKEFEYVFVDERDPVQDLVFRCVDNGEFIVWRSIGR